MKPAPTLAARPRDDACSTTRANPLGEVRDAYRPATHARRRLVAKPASHCTHTLPCMTPWVDSSAQASSWRAIVGCMMALSGGVIYARARAAISK